MASNNQKTPLLQLLKNNGGTLYVFPSASEDIGLNLNYNANTVGLSHYALLNIPVSQTVVSSTNSSAFLQNRFNPTIIPGHFEYVSKSSNISSVDDKPSWHLAASLQNYAMNFETLLVNQDTYNYKDYHTVSEKVFWKWLKSTGAIRWKNASLGYFEEGDDEAEDLNLYNRVVQCFGAIDSGNSLSTGFGMFNEVYVNIPTSYGSGKVFFSSSEDNNYHLNRQYLVSNSEKLEGRTTDENNAVIYTVNQPFTDVDSTATNEYYDTTCDTDALYKLSTINYNADTKTDSVDSDGELIENRISTLDGIEIVKNLTTIGQIFNAEFNVSTGYEVNSFDDININRVYSTLNEDTYSFEFNAILLYYSVYDNNNNTSDTALSTNLFGILFLDKPTETAGTTQNTGALTDFYIPTLTKKQSSTEGGFGTGYSFRINIKTQSVYDNQDSVINDNTTQTSVLAEDFNDVLYALNRAIDNMNVNVETSKAIQEKYTQILGYYGKQAVDISDLNNRLTAYINGERGDILSTLRLNASLFTSPNNEFRFGFDLGNTDSNGNTVYDILATLNSEGKLNTSVYVGNQSMIKENFVQVENYSETYDNVVDVNNDSILDNLFNSANTIIKNSRTRYDGYTNGENTNGGFYIDPDSSIFNTLKGLVLDENGDNYADNSTHTTYKDSVTDSLIYNVSYINYEKLVPYLIAELIKQKNTISDLAGLVNSLQSQINDLNSKIDENESAESGDSSSESDDTSSTSITPSGSDSGSSEEDPTEAPSESEDSSSSDEGEDEGEIKPSSTTTSTTTTSTTTTTTTTTSTTTTTTTSAAPSSSTEEESTEEPSSES